MNTGTWNSAPAEARTTFGLYTSTDLVAPVGIVVGNEAHGLADDAPVDGWITITQRGRSESLNVAMAATVLCFEVARQRDA